MSLSACSAEPTQTVSAPAQGSPTTTAADAVTRACAEPAGLDLATVVTRAADAGNPVPPLVRVLQDAVGVPQDRADRHGQVMP